MVRQQGAVAEIEGTKLLHTLKTANENFVCELFVHVQVQVHHIRTVVKHLLEKTVFMTYIKLNGSEGAQVGAGASDIQDKRPIDLRALAWVAGNGSL